MFYRKYKIETSNPFFQYSHYCLKSVGLSALVTSNFSWPDAYPQNVDNLPFFFGTLPLVKMCQNFGIVMWLADIFNRKSNDWIKNLTNGQNLYGIYESLQCSPKLMFWDWVSFLRNAIFKCVWPLASLFMTPMTINGREAHFLVRIKQWETIPPNWAESYVSCMKCLKSFFVVFYQNI